jgi:hypothetical protein
MPALPAGGPAGGRRGADREGRFGARQGGSSRAIATDESHGGSRRTRRWAGRMPALPAGGREGGRREADREGRFGGGRGASSRAIAPGESHVGSRRTCRWAGRMPALPAAGREGGRRGADREGRFGARRGRSSRAIATDESHAGSRRTRRWAGRMPALPAGGTRSWTPGERTWRDALVRAGGLRHELSLPVSLMWVPGEHAAGPAGCRRSQGAPQVDAGWSRSGRW